MIRTFFAIMLLAFSLNLSAQKFGHVHTVNLLAQLPEINRADSVLLVFQEQLMNQGDSMVAVFRENYNEYVRLAQSGTMSKIQAQGMENKLTREQEAIQQFEKEAQALIMQQRQDLYDPILNRIDEIIMAIGAEEGYSMIFDVSQQAMLYITASEDISGKILARLKP